ncbi:MAG: polypeptide-transport-associated protein ShlB-type [Herbaspirillum sp.]|nr:polypeptide-transport-associated protein ShlB-type [Herbaspirillum sp.]
MGYSKSWGVWRGMFVGATLVQAGLTFAISVVTDLSLRRIMPRKAVQLMTFSRICASLLWATVSLFGIAAPVSAANNAPDASSAAISDAQAQRRNAQQEALERERQQNAPNVDLQPPVAAIPNDDGLVAVESPCFKIDTLVLMLPPGLSEPVKAVGQKALAPDLLSLHASLRFASHYLERYRGQCIGREGANLIVRRLSALILQNGYSTHAPAHSRTRSIRRYAQARFDSWRHR